MASVTRRRLTPLMLGVGGVTFVAGLLFGYDQGVVSGALALVKVDLDLSTLESEIVTSWVTLGALFGALIAGGTADRIGRRWAAVSAGVLFALGALVEAVDAIGESATFFIFAALCVVSFVFVWYLVPETKGRSLEEIQERWVRNGDRMLDERDLHLPPTGPGGAVPG